MDIYRGNIYMAMLPTTDNSSVQSGVRPVIVVQNDIGNVFSPTVQVVPLTSRSKTQLPTHTIVVGHGLNKESIALAEQLTTVSKKSLYKFVGTVDKKTMTDINKCIAIQLGLVIC